MVRIIALIIFLFLGIYTYETFTGADFGVGQTVDWMINDGFAGGYGLAAGVANGAISMVIGVLDGT